jgi:hypothetical protein
MQMEAILWCRERFGYGFGPYLSGRHHNALNFFSRPAVLKALNLSIGKTLQGIGKLDLHSGRAQLYELPQDVSISGWNS